MSQPTPTTSELRDHLPAAVMLLLWLGLAVHTSGAMSVTTDEYWHWPVGVRNLVAGDFAADRLNPPLARMWAAIPGALAGVEVSSAPSHETLGEQFLAEHPDFFRWYVWGRYFNLAWAAATAVMIYELMRRWKGLFAARWGLAAFLCTPDVIAHASLVTPDSAAMAGFFAVSLATACWLRQLTWKSSLFLGAALGAMLAIKYTGIVFFPIVVVLGLARLFTQRQLTWREMPWRRGALQVAATLGICLFTIAAAYRFQGLFHSLAGFQFQSRDMQTMQNLAGPLARCPLPIPGDLILGIDSQRAIMEGQHPTFLNGEWSLTGFPSYFLWALVYKLPLAILGLSAIGSWCVLRDRQASRISRLAFFLPVAVLMTIASFSSMQLGFRYIMPVIPLLACACGAAMSGLRGRSRAVQIIASCLVAGALLSSWRYHPHHLAWFNELAGGPIGGRQHLIDSNLDWGQDLYRAKAVADRYPDEPLWLAYFGQVNPRAVGLNSNGPPPARLVPGLYLVSVNFSMGRPWVVRGSDAKMRPVNFEEFGGFRQLTPLEHVGYSIDLYRVTEADLGSHPAP